LERDRTEVLRRRDEGFLQGMGSLTLNHVNLVNPVYLTSHDRINRIYKMENWKEIEPKSCAEGMKVSFREWAA
jgi:hypothetical protein